MGSSARRAESSARLLDLKLLKMNVLQIGNLPVFLISALDAGITGSNPCHSDQLCKDFTLTSAFFVYKAVDKIE
jgi:hypothetical protein